MIDKTPPKREAHFSTPVSESTSGPRDAASQRLYEDAQADMAAGRWDAAQAKLQELAAREAIGVTSPTMVLAPSQSSDKVAGAGPGEPPNIPNADTRPARGWAERIPGFRSEPRWRRWLFTILGGLIILSLVGSLLRAVSDPLSIPEALSAFMSLVLVLVAANVGESRTRLPLVRSGNLFKAALGWCILVVLASIASGGLGAIYASQPEYQARIEATAVARAPTMAAAATATAGAQPIVDATRTAVAQSTAQARLAVAATGTAGAQSTADAYAAATKERALVLAQTPASTPGRVAQASTAQANPTAASASSANRGACEHPPAAASSATAEPSVSEETLNQLQLHITEAILGLCGLQQADNMVAARGRAVLADSDFNLKGSIATSLLKQAGEGMVATAPAGPLDAGLATAAQGMGRTLLQLSESYGRAYSRGDVQALRDSASRGPASYENILALQTALDSRRSVEQVTVQTPVMVGPTGSSVDDPATEHLAAAEAWRDAGELGLALEEARQALGLRPDHPAARAFVQEVAPVATAAVQAARAESTAAVLEARAQATAAVQAQRDEERAVIRAYAEAMGRKMQAAQRADTALNGQFDRVVVNQSLLLNRAWQTETRQRLLALRQAVIDARGHTPVPVQAQAAQGRVVAWSDEYIAYVDEVIRGIDLLTSGGANNATAAAQRIDRAAVRKRSAESQVAGIVREIERLGP
jgi:colicin import membrane protein